MKALKIFLVVFSFCGLLSGQTKTIVISADTSLSPASEIGAAYMITRIVFPAAWDSSSYISFQASKDGITFFDVFKQDSTELVVKVITGKSAIINPWEFYGLSNYIKIRSGTAAIPKQQTANRTFSVELKRISP